MSQIRADVTRYEKEHSHAVEDQVVALLHVFLGGVDDLFAGIVEGGECFVEGEIHPDCYRDKDDSIDGWRKKCLYRWRKYKFYEPD